MHAGADRSPAGRGVIRGPQSLVSGLVLVALALFALWLTSDLPQGTLRAMGPAMLPRWLAVGVGLCGLALVVIGFTHDGAPLEAFSLRGPVFVGIAILWFGMTIRGFSLGPLPVPQLGLLGAGPIAMMIAGFATAEARFRDLVILALALTCFCMLLFGDLLNLPIPMYPQAFADLYPAGWSSEGRLRATALGLAVLAFVIFLATHRRRPAHEPIDVVPDEHAGTV